MSAPPTVRFGLVVLEAVLTAKTGTWTERGIADLLAAALRDHGADASVRGAVLAYAADVRRRPFEAGDALHLWLIEWARAAAGEAAAGGAAA